MVDMSSTLSGLGPMFSSVSSLMMIGVLFLISLILLGVIGGFFYWMMLQRKRYGEFVVEIYGRDALGNPVVIMDNAGVFVNRKTGNKRLYLKKAKISLNADRIPYILDGSGRGKKYIKLVRVGLSNYKFIKMSVDVDVKGSFTVGE